LESGYTNPKMIVIKFRRGLNPAIVDVVATMVAGRPNDLDPDPWYEAAICINQNQVANAAFHSAHIPAYQLKTPVPTPIIRSQPATRFQMRFTHAIPTPGKARAEPTCFHCGQLGHMVHDCPQRLDVRSMNWDKVDILMEQLNARLDEINLSVPDVTSDETDETPDENVELGFPQSSR
jgi:hypothetical protein